MQKKRTVRIYIQGRKSPIVMRGKELSIEKFLEDYKNCVENKADGVFTGHHYVIRHSSITHIKVS